MPSTGLLRSLFSATVDAGFQHKVPASHSPFRPHGVQKFLARRRCVEAFLLRRLAEAPQLIYRAAAELRERFVSIANFGKSERLERVMNPLLAAVIVACLCMAPCAHARNKLAKLTEETYRDAFCMDESALGATRSVRLPLLTARDADAAGKAGEFDVWVLQQVWSPEICQNAASLPLCRSPTRFMLRNLTTHGLWPEVSDENATPPRWCGGACPRARKDALPSSDFLAEIADLLPELRRYMPDERVTGSALDTASSTEFWLREWHKHGTCSGLSPREYFGALVSLSARVGTPGILRKRIGGEVSQQRLHTSYTRQLPLPPEPPAETAASSSGSDAAAAAAAAPPSAESGDLSALGSSATVLDINSAEGKAALRASAQGDGLIDAPDVDEAAVLRAGEEQGLTPTQMEELREELRLAKVRHLERVELQSFADHSPALLSCQHDAESRGFLREVTTCWSRADLSPVRCPYWVVMRSNVHCPTWIHLRAFPGQKPTRKKNKDKAKPTPERDEL